MGAGIGPRCGVHAVPHRGVHQLVIRRGVAHLVDPMAVPVVGGEHRRVLFGEVAELDHRGAAGQRADGVHLGDVVGGHRRAREGLGDDRCVGEVDVDQFGNLVGDFVGAHATDYYITTSCEQGL